MTKSEYVKVSHAENYFGQKNLLQSQLELLRIIGGFKSYKKLRSEELGLKVSLRAKIAEMTEALVKLDKLLPKTSYNSEEQKKEISEMRKKRDLSLEEEISEIKEKLRKLQGGM